MKGLFFSLRRATNKDSYFIKVSCLSIEFASELARLHPARLSPFKRSANKVVKLHTVKKSNETTWNRHREFTAINMAMAIVTARWFVGMVERQLCPGRRRLRLRERRTCTP